MAWTFYLYDLAPSATSATFTGITNGANTILGYDTMIGAASGATITLVLDYGATQIIAGAVGIANHTFPSTATCKLEYWTGSAYTQIGATTDFTGHIDQVFAFGAGTATTKERITITGATGCKVGGICLLSTTGYHKIALSGVAPVGDIDSPMNAGIARQYTAIGTPIDQRIGGASEGLTLSIPFVSLSDSTAGAQGWLDDTFLRETSPVDGATMNIQGWSGPLWVVDDNGIARHCTLNRPVGRVWNFAAGRAEYLLSFTTLPHIGLV